MSIINQEINLKKCRISHLEVASQNIVTLSGDLF